METIDKVNKIKLVCHKVLANPNLLPREGKTYCNVGSALILDELGYTTFVRNQETKEPFIANEMCHIFDKSFERVDITKCIELIDKGLIFVACQEGNPHGHICVIYPSKTTTFSKKWSMIVPLVANIGKVNEVCGLNFAFSELPKIYLIGEPK